MSGKVCIYRCSSLHMRPQAREGSVRPFSISEPRSECHVPLPDEYQRTIPWHVSSIQSFWPHHQRGKRASPATDAPAATPFRASAQIMMST
jgi:hypothetical protein